LEVTLDVIDEIKKKAKQKLYEAEIKFRVYYTKFSLTGDYEKIGFWFGKDRIKYIEKEAN